MYAHMMNASKDSVEGKLWSLVPHTAHNAYLCDVVAQHLRTGEVTIARAEAAAARLNLLWDWDDFFGHHVDNYSRRTPTDKVERMFWNMLRSEDNLSGARTNRNAFLCRDAAECYRNMSSEDLVPYALALLDSDTPEHIIYQIQAFKPGDKLSTKASTCHWVTAARQAWQVMERKKITPLLLESITEIAGIDWDDDAAVAVFNRLQADVCLAQEWTFSRETTTEEDFLRDREAARQRVIASRNVTAFEIEERRFGLVDRPAHGTFWTWGK